MIRSHADERGLHFDGNRQRAIVVDWIHDGYLATRRGNEGVGEGNRPRMAAACTMLTPVSGAD